MAAVTTPVGSGASSPLASEDLDPRIDSTIKTLDWDTLLLAACAACKCTSATWAGQLTGGYNLVRLLQLDDQAEIVARVPCQAAAGQSVTIVETFCHRIASEVASMEYVATHTRIPIPRVIAYSTEPDGGGFGSPYILMSKLEGVQLSSIWDDMVDEKRIIILRQVVDIILQLSSLRFDQMGALFKGDGPTNSQFYINPIAPILDIEDQAFLSQATSKTYSNALDFWVTCVNLALEQIDNDHFGSECKSHDYARTWWLRSLIPTVIDTSLDAQGFPLQHGDFHSQNILVADFDTPSPRISAVIDWEFTSTEATSCFAQYPLFIVDDPLWDVNHPLKSRNLKDQSTFNDLIREAEGRLLPDGDLPLSQAFQKCQVVYLFQQCILHRESSSGLDKLLFELVFGPPVKDSDFEDKYWDALLRGILKSQSERFKIEVLVKEEALEVLGDELIPYKLSRVEFKATIIDHLDKFKPDGQVKQWLANK